MPKEKPKQSLESQLKMARPRRHEVKRVPLTPEEKDFLGEIMDKAVAAEKAGKLQEALNLYTEYKNELLRIKESLAEKGSEFTIDLKDYIDHADPVDINGKPVIEVTDKNEKHLVINEKGEQIGEEYDLTWNLKNINGRAAFNARKGNKEFIINEKGKKVGGEFDNVVCPEDLGGQIVFIAKKDGKAFIYTEKGKKIGEQYDSVDLPEFIKGKIFFLAKQGERWIIANEDGKELGKEYDDVKDLRFINNKITFRGKKGKKWIIANEDGEEFGEAYLYVESPMEIGGKLVYQAKKGRRWIIVDENGREFGEKYGGIGKPLEVAGKIIYSSIDREGNSFIVTEDGTEIGRDQGYKRTDNIKDINGTIVFTALKDKWYVVNEKGEQIADYYLIGQIEDIGGEIAIIASDEGDGSWFVANEQGKAVSEKYDEIYCLEPLTDNKAYIIARITDEEGDKIVKKIIEI